MTTEQMIGQMMLVGWQTPNAKDICEDIKRYHFGNVILFSQNVRSVSHIEDLCGHIQDTALAYNGMPAFIAIDQEGGQTVRIFDGLTRLPGHMAIAAASDEYASGAARTGKILALELKKLGINFNCAPVVDINSNPNNPVIATRSFGDNPARVAQLAGDFAAAMQENGVMSCYKHFLGHGDLDVDSHVDLPRLKKTFAEIDMAELVPYKSIKADAVMTAHILFTELDDKFPASISKTILRGILRERLKYRGLIISDCFEMEALMRSFSLGEAALFAVDASTDMITVGHHLGCQITIRNAMIDAVKNGLLPLETVQASNARIALMKEKYCVPFSGEIDLVKNERRARRISESSIAVLHGKPFEFDDHTVVVGVTNMLNFANIDANMPPLDVAEIIGAEFGLKSYSIDSKNFSVGEALEFAKGKKVVLCLADSHLTLIQKVLLASLLKMQTRVLLISMCTPYDVLNQELPECHICTFEYTSLACESLLKVLHGADATGICPVKLNPSQEYAGKQNGNYLVDNIMTYIRKNYAKKLTLRSVGAEFYISGGHLCKLMKQKLNKNFVDVVNEVRIGEAKRLLSTTTMHINEIASLCGFSDLNYFTKTFKLYSGVTPTYFRNNRRIYD